MAEVSIIVPVFNVENYIAECIESIQKQTFKDFEVLVVDDCGQDRSIDIVEKYAKKDFEDVSYIHLGSSHRIPYNTALVFAKVSWLGGES